MGMVRVGAGSIAYDGEEILGQPPHRIARRGLGYVPEDRRVFARLSVQETLECGRQPPRAAPRTWSDNDLLDLFPNLAAARHRLACTLHRRAQQILTLARPPLGTPRCLSPHHPRTASRGAASATCRKIAASSRA